MIIKLIFVFLFHDILYYFDHYQQYDELSIKIIIKSIDLIYPKNSIITIMINYPKLSSITLLCFFLNCFDNINEFKILKNIKLFII
jgi:hypothetical protein